MVRGFTGFCTKRETKRISKSVKITNIRANKIFSVVYWAGVESGKQSKANRPNKNLEKKCKNIKQFFFHIYNLCVYTSLA